MKKLVENGIEWLYRSNNVYTAQYRGYTISIRHRPTKPHWRLFVSHGISGGIGLSFKRQFHESAVEARSFGKMLVDLKIDRNETPYA